MKVIILCGGQGTRIREQTELRPKPMVEIGGRPILWHIMKIYAAHGFNEFILCLGYKGNVIKEYFLNYEAMNSDFTIDFADKGTIKYHGGAHGEANWKVTLVNTGESALTGARVASASAYLGESDDSFCVTYGDGVSNINLAELVRFHKSHGAAATVTGVRPPSRFGELHVTGDRVLAFSEKPQLQEGLINGGFFIFKRSFLKYVTTDPACILERAPLEQCAADGQLRVYEHKDFWQCMDTYRDWESLERQWNSGEAAWKIWK